MKKVLSVFIFSVIIIFCATFVVHATESNSAKLIVSYDMNESYTVVIPADFTIGSSGKATADITASNVVIDEGKYLEVSIKGDDYIDSWMLIHTQHPSNSITYSIGSEENGKDIVNNSVVLSISSGEISDSTITKTLYFSIEDEVTKSGTYVDALTFTANIKGQSTHPEEEDPTDQDTIYYSSLMAAVEDTAMEGDADATTAKVAVTADTETGRRTLQLMDDVTLTTTLNIEESLVLDLNGCEISAQDNFTPTIRTKADVTIEASTPDSAITVNAPAGTKGTVLSAMSGELTINGGTYTSNTSGAGTKTSQTQVLYAYTGTTLNVDNAVVIATDTNNGCVVGINGRTDSTLNIKNCDITVDSGESLENIGVNALGNAVLISCNVVAKADYLANAAGNAYASTSRGIYSDGSLELYDCCVWGAHSGVTVNGDVYVDGGVYEGYGHGSFYLRKSDTTSYFYNCQLNWAPMLEGTVADVTAGTNGAGFYIGDGADNVVAYFDNCDFNMNEGNGEIYKEHTVPLYGIVLRTSGGETNNKVYISNSYVEMANSQMFRGNGTSSHMVYNGVGNDWSKAAAIHKGSADSFVDTNESYAKE